MSEVKFREFWVSPEENSIITEEGIDYPCGECFNYEPPIFVAETIHVIEHAALAAKDAEIKQLQTELAEKDAVLNEVLSYLEWREDDLIGDDIKGDGRLTARFKQVVSLIEATFKKYKGEC